MSILENSLRQLVAASPLWKPGTKVIAALSGGADSLCLADVMAAQGEEDGVDVLAVHVQHHLRGEEAEQDARQVEDYCRNRGLAFRRVDVDARSLAEKRGFPWKMRPGSCAMKHWKPAGRKPVRRPSSWPIIRMTRRKRCC